MRSGEQGQLSLMKAGVNRRQFMKMMGISTAMLTTGGLLSACSSDADDGVDDVDAADAAADAEEIDDAPEDELIDDDSHDDDTVEEVDVADRRGLVIATNRIPEHMDPYRDGGNHGTRVAYSLYDNLIERDFKGGDTPGAGSGLNPMLAESWERLDDLTLEFQLREDVLFHNGTPMTAEDIKFTFDRLIGDDVDTELLSSQEFVGTISEVQVIDDYTVRFLTYAPDPILENRLCSWNTWIYPKEYYEEVGMEGFEREPIGTGPYKFVELIHDDRLILDAFDDYFMGTPPAARVEFRVIPEVAGRIAALASGEADIITNMPPDQVGTMEDLSGVHVKSIPLANCHVLVYNTKHPHIQDKRIRQAMNLSIDRELIIETLWGGRALMMRGHQFEEYGDLFNADRPYTPYDPDRARELLEEAGYDGEEIIYYHRDNNYTLENDVAQAIVSMWGDVGFNVSQQLMEAPSDLSDDERMSRPWSNSSFLADPAGGFWLRWGTGARPQLPFDEEAEWDAPARFNELGEALIQTLDRQERYEIFQEMLDIWEDDAPGTNLWIPMENYGIRDDIEWHPYSFYYMDFRPHNLGFVSSSG